MPKPNDFDIEVEYDTRRRLNERIALLEKVCQDLEYKVQQLECDLEFHRALRDIRRATKA